MTDLASFRLLVEFADMATKALLAGVEAIDAVLRRIERWEHRRSSARGDVMRAWRLLRHRRTKKDLSRVVRAEKKRAARARDRAWCTLVRLEP